MKKLVENNGVYEFTTTKLFKELGKIDKTTLEKVFEFAYDMSFGGKGEHRTKRSGGQKRRKAGEIFANTLQGKLAEFAIYNYLISQGIKNVGKPDLETFDLGIWDKFDLNVNDIHINIKSTKPFGQLLLLECDDWDNQGLYKPNLSNGNAKYDYFILTRVGCVDKQYRNDVRTIMMKERLLYSLQAEKEDLEKIFLRKEWVYDIPGFITHQELVNEVIGANFKLPQNSILGKSRTKMDANNYYVQTGDMTDISELKNLI